MKVIAINGSPRKGNTDFMLDILSNSISTLEIIFLRKKNIKFCDGECFCARNKKCKIEDDMLDIYKKLEEADLIILASPCYFSNVTAIMKNFMDRCNPYYYNRKLTGKGFFLISVGGYSPSIKWAIKSMENFLRGIYAKKIGSYYAVADDPSDLKNNRKVIKELKDIGKKLSKNY